MNLRVIAEVLGVLVILAGAVKWYHDMDLSSTKLRVLKGSLSMLYETKCNIEAEGRTLPKFLHDQIEEGQDEHEQLAGREYHAKPCDN